MADLMLKIAKDFSRCPGARYRTEGDFSGEEFRSEYLAPKIREALEEGVKLVIDLDGSAGYSTAFIEESFGGLIRNDGFSLDDLKNVFEFISNEDPSYIDDIEAYIDHAWQHR